MTLLSQYEFVDGPDPSNILGSYPTKNILGYVKPRASDPETWKAHVVDAGEEEVGEEWDPRKSHPLRSSILSSNDFIVFATMSFSSKSNTIARHRKFNIAVVNLVLEP